MLFFRSPFLPLIRARTKTQTIRLWQRPRVTPGQRAFVPGLHPDPRLSRLLITAVDPLPSLRSLTANDARADGFPTLHALRAELRRLYPNARPRNPHPDLHIYRIRFQYPAPISLPHPPRNSGRKPGAKPRSKTAISPHKSPRAATPPQKRRQLAHFLRSLAPQQRPLYQQSHI